MLSPHNTIYPAHFATVCLHTYTTYGVTAVCWAALPNATYVTCCREAVLP